MAKKTKTQRSAKFLEYKKKRGEKMNRQVSSGGIGGTRKLTSIELLRKVKKGTNAVKSKGKKIQAQTGHHFGNQIDVDLTKSYTMSCEHGLCYLKVLIIDFINF